MANPKILVDQRLLRGFRRRALKAYPLEHMEAIHGKVDDLTLKIYSIHPFDQESATKDSVTVKGEHIDQDIEDAQDAGLIVLGDIHTHPGLPGEGAAPSEADYRDAHHHGSLLLGICHIHKNKARMSTRIRFYLANKPLKLKIR